MTTASDLFKVRNNESAKTEDSKTRTPLFDPRRALMTSLDERSKSPDKGFGAELVLDERSKSPDKGFGAELVAAVRSLGGLGTSAVVIAVIPVPGGSTPAPLAVTPGTAPEAVAPSNPETNQAEAAPAKLQELANSVSDRNAVLSRRMKAGLVR